MASDCFVDVDTVRYSVPHRLVHRSVEVLVADRDVQIFDGDTLVARHRRCVEPHTRVVEPSHFDGIYRQREEAIAIASSPLARSLETYAAAIGGDS